MIRNLMLTTAVLATTATAAVFANENKITKGFKSYDAMGCMLLRECKQNVKEVKSIYDISSQYEYPDKFVGVTYEFTEMLKALNNVGAKVFLADSKYFPVGHRGVYHTVSNNMY